MPTAKELVDHILSHYEHSRFGVGEQLAELEPADIAEALNMLPLGVSIG